MKRLLALLVVCVMMSAGWAAQAESVTFSAVNTAVLTAGTYGIKSNMFDWTLFEEMELAESEPWDGQSCVTARLILDAILYGGEYEGKPLHNYTTMVEEKNWSDVWVIYHGVPEEDGYRLEWLMDSGGGYLHFALNPENAMVSFDYIPYTQGKADMDGMCAILQDITRSTGVACEYGKVPARNLAEAFPYLLLFGGGAPE